MLPAPHPRPKPYVTCNGDAHVIKEESKMKKKRGKPKSKLDCFLFFWLIDVSRVCPQRVLLLFFFYRIELGRLIRGMRMEAKELCKRIGECVCRVMVNGGGGGLMVTWDKR